ncbi:MAG TPA: HDOD domain-containing protein [Bryobacteraceae bacterium]|nr:HDOD domain-containing protein [Bryobacteraceae bacterium]
MARQPIFDRHRQLYAYELLYRSNASQTVFDGTDNQTATVQVIANTLLAIGIDNLLCGRKAFINFDRDLLLGGLHGVLPAGTLVIEILETVTPDDQVVDACRKLCAEGYTFALDDFVDGPQYAPLVPLAAIIKVDLRATSRPDQRVLLQKYRPLGISMLAEKVETQEEFEWALAAGYEYFQGYFFARPANLRGQRIPAAKFTCLLLLAEVQRVEVDFARAQELISRDVSLSYGLLMYVNSPLFTNVTEIRSIRHAIAVLGEEGIRHWAALAALPVMAQDKPGELITMSLVRARFCERLAGLVGISPPNLAFLMGLFSLLDALTDMPLRESLAKVHTVPGIMNALTGTAPPGDPYRDVYQMVCGYEAGDWDAVTALAGALHLQTTQIAEAYAASTFWAQQALHATFRKTETRKHVREAASGDLRLLWEDRAGGEEIIAAKLMNVSAEGMQILVNDKIPVLSYLSCNDPKLGICGRGRVRYCNYFKGKYLVGVEFRGGTGWRRPVDPEAPAGPKPRNG